MKTLLVAVFVSVSYLVMPVYAADIKTTPVGDPEVRKFSIRLCVKMMSAGEFGTDIVKEMEDQFLGYMKITRDTPNYDNKIIEFWNANKNS
jgi:hypothetical protein